MSIIKNRVTIVKQRFLFFTAVMSMLIFLVRIRIIKIVILIITHRLLRSSFLALPSRIPSMNHKKELLRSLYMGITIDMTCRDVGMSGFVKPTSPRQGC